MSRVIFEVEKMLIEKELVLYKTFLETQLRDYLIERPDEDEMKRYITELKSKITEDIGKSFEEFFLYITVPEWKVMFECDNYIDSGKTLDEQKAIIGSLIESLKRSGKIEDSFMTDEIRTSINSKFLCDDYKCCVLIELLEAEYRLCESSILWIDALLDRTRVMFYSGLFVGDTGKIEDVIEMINTKTFKTYFPPRLVALIKQMNITDSFNEKVTLFDLLHFLIFLSIGCGISDDYMDIEEDILNNKITGVTQCTKQGISVRYVIATTIEFLKGQVVPNEYAARSKEWFINLMSLMYIDLDTCLSMCKEISPYGYKIVFQRKS